MSREIPSAGESVQRFLFRGIRGESIRIQLECEQETPNEIIDPKDHVARPIPIIDVEEKLMNMRAYIGGVLQMSDSEGNVIQNVIMYANLLNNMQCNDDWIAIGERNKDGIFHVHTLARTGVRTDSYRRTQQSIWDITKRDPTVIAKFGNCTIDMLKCQKAHKPCALLQYMCKAPIWICSNSDKLLQMTYDIMTWDLGARFKTQPEDKQASIDEANPMVKEILQCIMEHKCKSLEDVIKKGPELVVKHLHKPGFGNIVQNCLTFSKCVGHAWSLKQYGQVVSDPSSIHAILIHQGISPDVFDNIFWQWITKRHAKRNTIHIFGPSNTGKSCFFSGLGKCCPSGEIVNGQNFQFEGLIDAYWGKWEEPLCAPEMAEKFKQIAEGMECAIPVKFKRPYVLPRTPIVILTNAMIWEWCPNQKGPFRNRMWFFTFAHDLTNGIFVPRTTESSCQCRYCEQCGGRKTHAGSSTTASMQRKNQSIQGQLATGNAREPDVGTGSMSERAGSSRQSDRTRSSSREPGSNNAAGGSTSTAISGSNRSDTTDRSSNTDERVCDSTTRSTKPVESSDSRGHPRHDSGRNGGSGSRTDVTRRHAESDEILSPMVSVGGARPKKRKMEFQIQTDQQQLGGELVTTLKVPGKEEWASYLSYIYHRYELAVGYPDLHAYEELDSDSE